MGKHQSDPSCPSECQAFQIPTILSPEQIKLFLEGLVDDLPRTAVSLVATTGLRVGELLGLKWEDVDFEGLELRIIRYLVKQQIERCKTEASRKSVPIGSEVAEILFAWRARCAYNQPEDWVFASPATRGRQPCWPSSIYRVYLRPVLKGKLKITDPVGLHTLRYSLGTLMKAKREDVKTIQETLRHANFKVTMDVYTQAVTAIKRPAHDRVVRQIMDDGEEA